MTSIFNNYTTESISASNNCYQPSVMTNYKVPAEVASKWSVEYIGATPVSDVIAKKIADDGRNPEDPFFVVDLGRVMHKHKRWVEELPTVQPFFAIKCNPNTAIIRTLASFGAGFDCASQAEMQQVLGCGVSPDRIIFANPTKMRSHIRFAKSCNVKMMTFDNVDELYKMYDIFPEAELVLRIVTDDSHSLSAFSSKFGAHLDSVEELIITAKSLGAKLKGVSFHVGSRCLDSDAFEKAILSAVSVFRLAASHGYMMDLLDLGGGWPGSDNDEGANFTDMAAAVRPLLPLFPPHVKVIAEPGRYFVAESHTLAVNIFAKRKMERDGESKILYYINDGVYQSFNCIYFDHYNPEPLLLHNREGETVKTTLFGPTCDSIDCVAKDIFLPEMEVGDWLYFKEMGAYTVAAASSFNGFSACPNIFYIASDVE